MKILLQPHPILSRVCEPIAASEYSMWGRIGIEMLQLMHDRNGIGLAAPQVGLLSRCIVVSVSGIEFVAINPMIIWRKGRMGAREGCLSAPGKLVRVDRAESIRLVYITTIGGSPHERRARGLLARVIQHEVDHLDGICKVK